MLSSMLSRDGSLVWHTAMLSLIYPRMPFGLLCHRDTAGTKKDFSLNFIRFLLHYFSSLSRSLWTTVSTILCISHSAQFCITCKLAACAHRPPSRSLTNRLTSIGLDTDSLLLTGFHLNFVFWAWNFKLFSIHLTVNLTSLYFSSL